MSRVQSQQGADERVGGAIGWHPGVGTLRMRAMVLSGTVGKHDDPGCTHQCPERREPLGTRDHDVALRPPLDLGNALHWGHDDSRVPQCGGEEITTLFLLFEEQDVHRRIPLLPIDDYGGSSAI